MSADDGAMWMVNRSATAAVDALMAPLRGLPPLLSLAVLALLTAVAMLIVFRVTLNRGRVESVKRQMHAAIFEMRLFQDDLRIVLRAALEVVRHNGSYLLAWLWPVAIVSLPLTLFLGQLDSYYGYTGLAPGRATLLVAEIEAGPEREPQGLALEAPDAVEITTPAVWFPTVGQAVWRVSARETGAAELRVRAAGETIEKRVVASTAIARRSPARVSAGFVEEFLNPSEPPLPASQSIRSIRIGYPVREIAVFGWHVSWLVPYFAFLLVFAYALKRPFRVVF